LTRRYVEDDLKSLYKGSLFYARDAFAGLHTMDKLTSGNGEGRAGEAVKALKSTGGEEVDSDSEDLVGEEAKLGIRKAARPRGALKVGVDTTHTERSNVSDRVPIPKPPFLGSKVV
jgi:5-methyltetrahydrofolate--homocysteine methyltransferase